MKLSNEFIVSAPLKRTWETLLDIERVATCLPGASVQPGAGDGVFRGGMKMKLGPVAVDYKGTVRMLEIDEDAHVATFEAKAREAKGQGTAAAQITNRLVCEGDAATRVTVETNLDITGRQAQFGRGIMQDVSEKMLGEFAKRLEQEILAGPPASQVAQPSGTQTPVVADGLAANPAAPPRALPGESEPLDLGSVVSGPLLKRAIPVAAGAVVLGFVAVLLGTLGAGRRRGTSITFNYR